MSEMGKLDCDACALKPRCSPNAPARKILRSILESARDTARDIVNTDAYVTSRRERKKVEMLFANLKRILRLDRLRHRGPNGARDEFLLAATAQNLRKISQAAPDAHACDGRVKAAASPIPGRLPRCPAPPLSSSHNSP